MADPATPESAATPEELLGAAAEGDERAFEQLYAVLAGPVFGLVRRVLRDTAQAEEVTRDVFVELWRTATGYRPELGGAVDRALTLAHRRAVERAECPGDAAELRLTAHPGPAVPERPPKALRQRVLAEVHRTPQDPPGTAPSPAPDLRRATPRWVLTVTAAAAVVALVLAGTFGVFALRAQHELAETQEQLATAAAEYAPLAQVLGQPDVRSVTARAAGGGNGVLIVSSGLGRAVFLAFHLPAAPPGRTYQAWAIGPSGTTSLGVLVAAGSDSTAPVVLRSLRGVRDVGVTVEPAGGSRRPTTEPLMLVPVGTG